MNQILYTADQEDEKNKVKKIIVFFAIVIILFGLIITSESAYTLISRKNMEAEKRENAKVPVIAYNIENNVVDINISNSRELEKVIYRWNDEEAITEPCSSDSYKTKTNIPGGKNTLYVKAIDVQGKVSEIRREISYVGTYMDLSVLDNKMLKIVVTDMEGLQSVRYNWNSEDSVESYPTGNDNTTIIVKTPIPIGMNTIKVSGVNRNNEIVSKEMQVQGITKPKISVYYDEAKTKIFIKYTDEQGLKTYSYIVKNAPIESVIVNNKLKDNYAEYLKEIDSKLNANVENSDKEVIIELPFKEGLNALELKAINIEGATETISGWCAK